MRNARRYAQALVRTVTSEEDLESVGRDLEAVQAIFGRLPALGRLLAHPGIPAARKRVLLETALPASQSHPATQGIITILVERRQLALLPEIATWYGRLKDRQIGVTPAEVTTPAPVLDADRAAWSAALARAAGTRVRVDFRTDRSLIGGAVARVGSVLYDGSVRGSLARMRQSLLGE